ncbi:unnamed protein product [Nippostrongylus brasiliensis]|uniref:AMP-binding domain-containing protein n=1 Tax=Nippostrongylus brasiliensis TaxID=27835 RepID=A0A0N4XQU0_NIPBR|nr:unnamed protein product [Nippostrongylus brasiliensis]
MHPVRLIRVDDKTGEVVRSQSGLCIACNPGESGAMVSTIRKNNPLLQFEGYLNQSETNKKIIRDVFSKGDSCFVSGDLLYWDRLGYVYFKDRTGDTFRWKGENVSTTEVEAILHPERGVADATVYGVTVPGMLMVAKVAPEWLPSSGTTTTKQMTTNSSRGWVAA